MSPPRQSLFPALASFPATQERGLAARLQQTLRALPLLLLAALVLAAAGHVQAQAQQPTAQSEKTAPATGGSSPEFVASKVLLADKRINESSGLARSLRRDDVFWTHNDSGGEPCVFAINTQGETLAKVRVRDAANFDWEDMASGLDDQGQPCLYIGDIGDNFRIRPTLQIYCLPEPELPATPAGQSKPPQVATHEILSAQPQVWHLSYPDGRHNAESLFVHPQTRALYILTKEPKGHSALYELAKPPATGQAAKLQKVTELTFPARARLGKVPERACEATAADLSADGRRFAVATYSYIHEWKLQPDKPLAENLQAPETLLTPPLTKGMEALCYGADSRTLWLTSEVLPTPLYSLGRR